MNLKKIIEIILKVISAMLNHKKLNSPIEEIQKPDTSRKMQKIDPVFEMLKKKIIAGGGQWVEGQTLFLVGMRSLRTPGFFDDRFYLLHWSDNLDQKLFSCLATTDPGVAGSNFVAPGVYNGLWERGNRASFAKLFKVKKFMVWRQNGSLISLLQDIDRDLHPDNTVPVEKRNQEYQNHPMTMPGQDRSDKMIGNFSLGCCGPARYNDWIELDNLAVIHESQIGKKARIGYALFTDADPDIANLLKINVRRKKA